MVVMGCSKSVWWTKYPLVCIYIKEWKTVQREWRAKGTQKCREGEGQEVVCYLSLSPSGLSASSGIQLKYGSITSPPEQRPKTVDRC